MKELRSSFVAAALFLLCALQGFAGPISQGSQAYLGQPLTARAVESTILPTSLEGKAYEIALARDGKPLVEMIRTALPVLFYAGESSDGRYRAYTSLAQYDGLAPNGHRTVTLDEANALQNSRLVLSGDLWIEDLVTGKRWNVNASGQYVVAAAWSPMDPSSIAFTFSSGSAYGLVVANVQTKHVRLIEAADVLPDRVSWSFEGGSVEYYAKDEKDNAAAQEGESISSFHLASVPVFRTSLNQRKSGEDWSLQLPRPRKIMSKGSRQGFEIRLPDGTELRGDNFFGGAQSKLYDPTGRLIGSARLDLIVGVLPEGIVFKTVTPDGMKLEFLSRDGQISVLALPASSVSYFLPFLSAGSRTVAVTQVGNGYTTQCNVFDHTGALAYAYDLQATVGSDDWVEAAASGTIAYLASFVTCNSGDNGSDGTFCADYSPTCNSNSGWGNVVIIQHADGTWTKYAHLKYGTVLPPSTGVSVAYGCEIGEQGHTGYTIGNRNGCGDHLHFQRQLTGDRGGTSTSISFADQVNPLRCTTYASGNIGRSCLF